MQGKEDKNEEQNAKVEQEMVWKLVKVKSAKPERASTKSLSDRNSLKPFAENAHIAQSHGFGDRPFFRNLEARNPT